MKKHLFLLAMILALACIPNYAQTVVNVNGLRFLIENGNAIVGRQDKELSGDIVIPASIEHEGRTYPVTSFVQPTNLTAWSSNSVTTEGGAFQSCPITSIVIPSSISVIEAGAFSGCTYLKSVELPDNLKGIGAASFSGCTSLENIEIPELVTSFGSNSNYGFVSYTFGGCSKLKTIHIPSGVTTLYAGCFMGAGLDSIYIPKTITSLYDDCLSSSNLRIVKMGIADLTKLTYSQTCFGTNNITNANLYVPKGSISVYQEYEPWSNFKSLQEYGEEGETFVPDQINVNYEGIKYILKDGVATIARQPQTLSGNIVIPENVIYNEVNYPVTSMVAPTDLVCYSSNTISCTGGAFQGSAIESITIPSSITTIAAGAFQNCSNLKKVVLPSSIKMLSAACFAGCYNLEDINIPDGITDIASYTAYGYRSYVFGGCSKIKSFIIPSGVTTLASGCFLNSGLESVSIPANCTSMAEDCLDARNLTTVTIFVRDLDNLSYTEACFGNVSNSELRVPKGSKQVYQEYYPWMSFKSIEEFDDGNGEFVPSKITTRIDNIRYILNGNDAIVGRQNKDLSGDIIIPSSVSYEGKDYIVSSMVEPTNLIAWSSNTVSTENGAFQGCPISSITLPSTIKVIPAGAFYSCSSLEIVSLPEGITQLGAACFANCSKIVEIQIPESVIDLGSYTAYGYKSYILGNCSSLKKVNIPKNVTKFTEGCFKGSGLETFIIPSNVVRLEEDCFSMNNLRGIKITHTNLDALTYTESIFSNVSNVSLYVPEGTATLYQEFYPWKNFKEIIEYKDQNDEFNFNAYGLTYVLPDEVSTARSMRANYNGDNIYEKDYIASGISIINAESPSKEGYTFFGWTDLPETMPAHDVIVTGLFYLFGDVNTDENVDVVDVVDIARFVVSTPSVSFYEKLADLNFDNTVNIADAVTLVNHIAGDQNFARAMTSFDYDQCQLQLVSTQKNTISLCLDGDADFTAFQFEVELPENTDITAVRINGQRMDGHQLLYNKVADNRYRVAVLSLSNAVFKGNEGELLNISIDGLPTNEISIHDILFVTKNGTGISLDDISLSEVTGISNLDVNEGNNVIYDLQGRKLSKAQRGVNIVNGKKVVVK